jgi:hypothetical protein
MWVGIRTGHAKFVMVEASLVDLARCDMNYSAHHRSRGWRRVTQWTHVISDLIARVHSRHQQNYFAETHEQTSMFPITVRCSAQICPRRRKEAHCHKSPRKTGVNWLFLRRRRHDLTGGEDQA